MSAPARSPLAVEEVLARRIPASPRPAAPRGSRAASPHRRRSRTRRRYAPPAHVLRSPGKWGVLGAAQDEAAQNLPGPRGARARGGGVLHDLVVRPDGQIPVVRVGGEHQREVRPLPVLPGHRPVQLRGADVLQPRHQREAKHMSEGDGDDGGAVGVGVLPVHFHTGAVPRHTLDPEAAPEAGQDLSRELVDADGMSARRTGRSSRRGPGSAGATRSSGSWTRRRTCRFRTHMRCRCPTTSHPGQRAWRSPAPAGPRAVGTVHQQVPHPPQRRLAPAVPTGHRDPPDAHAGAQPGQHQEQAAPQHLPGQVLRSPWWPPR